jgi:hypothetical protein
MAKLGYTWYPKDWGNSEAVFQLNLTQRGLYRELIDLAMLNDNKTIVNYKVWSRKWAIEEELLMFELSELQHLGLIEHKGKAIFIPSCEPRLKMVRGGSNGGKKSKPTSKGIVKPISKPTPKGDSNQKKEKGKERERKGKLLQQFKSFGLENGLDLDKVEDTFLNAWDYYEDLDWKNKNDKLIVNLQSTIRKVWFKDLSKFKKEIKIDKTVLMAAQQIPAQMQSLMDKHKVSEQYLRDLYKK